MRPGGQGQATAALRSLPRPPSPGVPARLALTALDLTQPVNPEEILLTGIYGSRGRNLMRRRQKLISFIVQIRRIAKKTGEPGRRLRRYEGWIRQEKKAAEGSCDCASCKRLLAKQCPLAGLDRTRAANAIPSQRRRPANDCCRPARLAAFNPAAAAPRAGNCPPPPRPAPTRCRPSRRAPPPTASSRAPPCRRAGRCFPTGRDRRRE